MGTHLDREVVVWPFFEFRSTRSTTIFFTSKIETDLMLLIFIAEWPHLYGISSWLLLNSTQTNCPMQLVSVVLLLLWRGKYSSNNFEECC